MKVIIAGSRKSLDVPTKKGSVMMDIKPVERAIEESGYEITEIVSGGAPGPDTAAVCIAKQRNIPRKMFYALWNKYGTAAGPLRNKQMAEYADALIAIWDGQSRGTKNMIDTMEKMGKPVYVHLIQDRKNSV
jgi:hypothetical protein